MRTYSVWIIATCLAVAASAQADPAPKRTKAFKANYATLVQDQKAAPGVAECIATAYDYVSSSKIYDRLGFTKKDISKARTASTAIAVSGEARTRANSNWIEITLNCGLTKGNLVSVAIKR